MSRRASGGERACETRLFINGKEAFKGRELG